MNKTIPPGVSLGGLLPQERRTQQPAFNFAVNCSPTTGPIAVYIQTTPMLYVTFPWARLVASRRSVLRKAAFHNSLRRRCYKLSNSPAQPAGCNPPSTIR
jgi:hypothetical protein